MCRDTPLADGYHVKVLKMRSNYALERPIYVKNSLIKHYLNDPYAVFALIPNQLQRDPRLLEIR